MIAGPGLCLSRVLSLRAWRSSEAEAPIQLPEAQGRLHQKARDVHSYTLCFCPLGHWPHNHRASRQMLPSGLPGQGSGGTPQLPELTQGRGGSGLALARPSQGSRKCMLGLGRRACLLAIPVSGRMRLWPFTCLQGSMPQAQSSAWLASA